MTNKEEYKRICEETGNSIPIYSQYWWMEAVCTGKEWDVLIARSANGTVVATLPYLLGSKWGQRYIVMPPLTQTNGIHYFYSEIKDEREKLEFEKKAANLIIDQIKGLKVALFLQNFEPSFTNWLPFCWNGYRETTRYTYQITDTKNADAVFANFSAAKQRQIRKAERNGLQLRINALRPKEFFTYHQQVLAKQGKQEEIGENAFLALANAAISSGRGAILSIESQDGTLQAALFMVWDTTTAYYLVPANDRDFSTTGAATLLVWEAIKMASQKNLRFDFEGSMSESIENSYNQFGSEQTSYMQLWKANNLLAKIWSLRNR